MYLVNDKLPGSNILFCMLQQPLLYNFAIPFLSYSDWKLNPNFELKT